MTGRMPIPHLKIDRALAGMSGNVTQSSRSVPSWLSGPRLPLRSAHPNSRGEVSNAPLGGHPVVSCVPDPTTLTECARTHTECLSATVRKARRVCSRGCDVDSSLHLLSPANGLSRYSRQMAHTTNVLLSKIRSRMHIIVPNPRNNSIKCSSGGADLAADLRNGAKWSINRGSFAPHCLGGLDCHRYDQGRGFRGRILRYSSLFGHCSAGFR